MSKKSSKVQKLSGLIWSIAEILRGDFKQSEYGKVILPFIVMRRLDCILEDSKSKVLDAHKNLSREVDDQTKDMILYDAVGKNVNVYNISKFTFESLKGQDPSHLQENLIEYITKFSPNVQDIFLNKFLICDQIKRLQESEILWRVFDRVCQFDLHPDKVSNIEMGNLFEELIRRFSEISNETAGEHFTPREVIRLIVELLLVNDVDALTGSGIIRRVYDPACGTGGMLIITEEAMKKLNDKINIELFGQELNGESYGICKSDMLVTGHDPERIAFGNSLTDDAHADSTFHYLLSNPPYGVNWDKYKESIQKESKELGFQGRFGAGTPRISDGQLLFLQHMISKMRQDDDGSRLGIVMNGSPLFTGGAGSSESEIRRWMLENDWIEAIVALPTDLFYNTGIQTYVWLLTNRKTEERKGKVQLINATSEHFWTSMSKSLGSKRRMIPKEARHEIVRIYSEMLNGDCEKGHFSKVFDLAEFGFREIRIERPLRLNFLVSPERIERLSAGKLFRKLSDDEQKQISDVLQSNVPETLFRNPSKFKEVLHKSLDSIEVKLSTAVKKEILFALSERDEKADCFNDKDGNPEPDKELRDNMLVPLKQDWQKYFESEILPFTPDAWVDKSYTDKVDRKVGRVGYEINFNRYFHNYNPPRPLEEIDEELKQLEAEIAKLIEVEVS